MRDGFGLSVGDPPFLRDPETGDCHPIDRDVRARIAASAIRASVPEKCVFER